MRVVHPWMINAIQNTENQDDTGDVKKYAYEVTMWEAIYSWYDFLSSLLIAFVQADLLLVEVACHIITSMVTTYYYVSKKEPEAKEA